MATTCVAATIGALSVATALFSGVVQQGDLGGELLSVVLAGLAGIAIAGAAALDG